MFYVVFLGEDNAALVMLLRALRSVCAALEDVGGLRLALPRRAMLEEHFPINHNIMSRTGTNSTNTRVHPTPMLEEHLPINHNIISDTSTHSTSTRVHPNAQPIGDRREIPEGGLRDGATTTTTAAAAADTATAAAAAAARSSSDSYGATAAAAAAAAASSSESETCTGACTSSKANTPTVSTRVDPVPPREATTNTGGVPKNTGGAPTNTGWVSTNTGGESWNTGGVPLNTGGAPTNTGGVPTNTGDASLNTGGARSNTGGTPTNTGGVQLNTGGAPWNTGWPDNGLEVRCTVFVTAPRTLHISDRDGRRSAVQAGAYTRFVYIYKYTCRNYI